MAVKTASRTSEKEVRQKAKSEEMGLELEPSAFKARVQAAPPRERLSMARNQQPNVGAPDKPVEVCTKVT